MMKVFIGLVTPNVESLKYFTKLNNSLVPTAIISNGAAKKLNLSLSFGASTPGGDGSNNALEKYIIDRTKNCQGCILLLDKRCNDLNPLIKSSYFTCVVDIGDGIPSRNFLTSVCVQSLKNFSRLALLMADHDNEQVLILPFRNFKANELRALAVICQEKTLDGEFLDCVMPFISLLKKRKRRPTYSAYRDKFLLDDDHKIFQFGKEVHARLSTGGTHNIYCKITGSYRFGCKIREDRHFNMSMFSGKSQRFSGGFLNCHGELIHSKNVTHINIFSNDCH